MKTRLVSVFLLIAVTLLTIGGAAPADAGKRFKTITKRYSNPAAIVLPEVGVAVPYPSQIIVGGLKSGQIKDVNVILHGFSHTYPRDVDILLVGPNGENAIVLSDIAGSTDVTGLHLVLDDQSAVPLPEGVLTSGTYHPTNADDGDTGDPFTGQTPSGNSLLAIFKGDDPNGSWRLYVVDDHGGDQGSIVAGWSVEITAKVAARKKK